MSKLISTKEVLSRFMARPSKKMSGNGFSRHRMILISSLICLMFLVSSVAAFAAARDDLRLPKGLKVGTISGPGGEALTRALSKKAWGGGRTGILSGQVSMVRQVASERETVIVEKQIGEVYEIYKPDPFTTRLWRVTETPMGESLETFDLERETGAMVFDWRVNAVDGRLMDQGRVSLDLSRSRGGYLAKVGAAPSLNSGRRSATARFEQYLAAELARQLTLDLGRPVTASDLENADDQWSRKARALVSSGDWEGARKLWLELLDLNSEYGPALYNLGLYYERQKNPEEAWRWYRKVFLSEKSDLHRAALTRLTDSLSRAGRLPQRNAR